MKYGNLNFLEPSGPLQACNGTALPLPFTLIHSAVHVQCPVWLFFVVPWLRAFLECCSGTVWVILRWLQLSLLTLLISHLLSHSTCAQFLLWGLYFNTLWTGDADLRLYITTVQDGWRKSAFLTRAWFPRTIDLITQYMEHFSEWSCWQMFIETRVFGEYFLKISVHKNS